MHSRILINMSVYSSAVQELSGSTAHAKCSGHSKLWEAATSTTHLLILS